MAAPVVEPPAAVGGLVAPFRPIFPCRRTDATGVLAESALDVDHLAELAASDRLLHREVIHVPPTVMEHAQHPGLAPGLIDQLGGVRQRESHRLFDHDVLSDT